MVTRRAACKAKTRSFATGLLNIKHNISTRVRRYAEHKAICSRNVVFILEFRVQPTTFDEGSHTVSSSCLEEIYTDEFSPPNDSWEWFTVRFSPQSA
jgi:hypothetical protein